MNLEIQCSQCGRRYGVPDRHADRQMKCPGCGTIISVPKIAPVEPVHPIAESAAGTLQTEVLPPYDRLAGLAQGQGNESLLGGSPLTPVRRRWRGMQIRPMALVIGLGVALFVSIMLLIVLSNFVGQRSKPPDGHFEQSDIVLPGSTLPWKRYVLRGAGCSVMLPREPQYEELVQKLCAASADVTEELKYHVSCIDYRSSIIWQYGGREGTLNALKNEHAKIPGWTFIRDTKIVLGEWPGREYTMRSGPPLRGPTRYRHCRDYLVGNRLYSLDCTSTEESIEHPDIQTFFQSFCVGDLSAAVAGGAEPIATERSKPDALAPSVSRPSAPPPRVASPSRPQTTFPPPSVPAPGEPILFQPVFVWAGDVPTHQGTGFLINTPGGQIAGVTSAHFIDPQGRTLLRAEWHDVVADQRKASFAESWGEPGKLGIDRHASDRTLDYLVLRVDSMASDAAVLELDDRTVIPLNERVWFPDKASNAPLGYHLVEGSVVEVDAMCISIKLDSPIMPKSQSGSPVISQKTGRVIGTFSTCRSMWSGQSRLTLCPASGIRAVVARSDYFPPLSSVVGKRHNVP